MVDESVVSGGRSAGTVRVIVFSGPPCSGKTTLARFVAGRLGLPHLEMDRIRRLLLPGEGHGTVQRDLAYRAMHDLATVLVRSNRSTVLDATYGRARQRSELERLCRREGCALMLIECRVPPEIAVRRFRTARDESHPAVDLTPDRVRRLAEEFPYYGRSVVLDTAADPEASVDRALAHLHSKRGISLEGHWSLSGRETDAVSIGEASS